MGEKTGKNWGGESEISHLYWRLLGEWMQIREICVRMQKDLMLRGGNAEKTVEWAYLWLWVYVVAFILVE